MTSFRGDGQDLQRVDYALLQNGAVTLYWRLAYLEEDITWLTAHGYNVHRFNAASWGSEADMHSDLARDLAFPDYYGRNLDALNDSLSDLDLSAEGGMAIVLVRFDSFAQRYHDVAQKVLDIAEHVSRRYLLRGRRFLMLVQSDDPRIEFEPLGAVATNWNHREWLNTSREPKKAT